MADPGDMNKKELLETAIQRAGLSHLPRKDAEHLLNTLIEVIKDNVAAGGEVTLKDFGTFTLAHHRERRGVNPVTGEQMLIGERTFPKFRPGKGWVELVGNTEASAG